MFAPKSGRDTSLGGFCRDCRDGSRPETEAAQIGERSGLVDGELDVDALALVLGDVGRVEQRRAAAAVRRRLVDDLAVDRRAVAAGDEVDLRRGGVLEQGAL